MTFEEKRAAKKREFGRLAEEEYWQQFEDGSVPPMMVRDFLLHRFLSSVYYQQPFDLTPEELSRVDAARGVYDRLHLKLGELDAAQSMEELEAISWTA